MLGIKNSDYAIELLDSNIPPIRTKLKRYTTQERDVMKQEIDKMLEAKIIEPSFAPWCFPIKIVPKPENDLRHVNCASMDSFSNVSYQWQQLLGIQKAQE